jgi:hypothetical protein
MNTYNFKIFAAILVLCAFGPLTASANGGGSDNGGPHRSETISKSERASLQCPGIQSRGRGGDGDSGGSDNGGPK